MKVVLQRVKSAYVKVDSSIISEINHGYLLLWGIEEADSEVESDILINKILNFRVFSDENLKMNKSIVYTFVQFVNGNTYSIKLFTTKKRAYEYSREIKNLPDYISKSEFYKKVKYNPFENSFIEWSHTDYSSDMQMYDYSVQAMRLN